MEYPRSDTQMTQGSVDVLNNVVDPKVCEDASEDRER
jgi:hypothetical protein